ncbi:hypothetical protein [Microcystis aeruginosa]|jgi:hypothetical protein|uniref:hypothetical protein n=1 Tax=Microcystis aeruginosa TaxID=1126 RepID=UPI001230DE5B|nr:hypothetical protein [Microcystis aeruginosa]GCA91179.1 hypothetical protein MiTa_04547 [Microcystis aeruginosa NIES-4264]
MDWNDLTDEEKEIVRRYRQLPDSKKKAVLISKEAFFEWVKTALRWIWDNFGTQIITAIFEGLRQLMSGR